MCFLPFGLSDERKKILEGLVKKHGAYVVQVEEYIEAYVEAYRTKTSVPGVYRKVNVYVAELVAKRESWLLQRLLKMFAAFLELPQAAFPMFGIFNVRLVYALIRAKGDEDSVRGDYTVHCLHRHVHEEWREIARQKRHRADMDYLNSLRYEKDENGALHHFPLLIAGLRLESSMLHILTGRDGLIRVCSFFQGFTTRSHRVRKLRASSSRRTAKPRTRAMAMSRRFWTPRLIRTKPMATRTYSPLLSNQSCEVLVFLLPFCFISALLLSLPVLPL